jgi:hypothetical protein
MSDNLSLYAENKLFDHLLGTAAFTMPAQVYLALYTSATDEASGGTEVPNAGGYVRVAVDFSPASGGAANPTADVLYPEATTIWGNITHVGLMDSATYGGGNRLMHGPLAAPKQIDVGDAFRIPLADLDTALQ